MNKSYKILGRNPFNKKQVKKRVYTSELDYIKYKDDLTNRYLNYLDVEHYELINGKWMLIFVDKYRGGCTWIHGYEY